MVREERDTEMEAVRLAGDETLREVRVAGKQQGCNSIDILGTLQNLSLIMFGVLRHVLTSSSLALKLSLNLFLNPSLNPKCLLNCIPD